MGLMGFKTTFFMKRKHQPKLPLLRPFFWYVKNLFSVYVKTSVYKKGL